MHQLVQAASKALSQQDAEELERLLEAARAQAVHPLSLNLGELSRASQVLDRQLHAAEIHLGIQSRMRGRENSPWVL